MPCFSKTNTHRTKHTEKNITVQTRAALIPFVSFRNTARCSVFRVFFGFQSVSARCQRTEQATNPARPGTSSPKSLQSCRGCDPGIWCRSGSVFCRNRGKGVCFMGISRTFLFFVLGNSWQFKGFSMVFFWSMVFFTTVCDILELQAYNIVLGALHQWW